VSKGRRNRNQIAQPQSTQHAAIASVTQAVSFSGPLPHPSILAKYNEVIPDGAERIMAMAERQSTHRESLEAQVVAGNVAAQARGSHYAFILCLVALIGGFALIFTGRNVSGLVSIIGSLTALASVFVYGKIQQKNERKEKASALTSRNKN
jgi:uncharacterized membrane protein